MLVSMLTDILLFQITRTTAVLGANIDNNNNNNKLIINVSRIEAMNNINN